MISRREAIGGVMATVIGGTAVRVGAERQQAPAMRRVSLTFRGGYGFLITNKKSLLAMTPKKPADACADWMDHPLYIKGSDDDGIATVPQGMTVERSKVVPSIWAVRIEGRCSIRTGGPTSELVGPQYSEVSARLEEPYTPVPYNSENGWNDAAWLLPLGDAPADLETRIQDSLVVNGGRIDVLTPPNTGTMRGRWAVPAMAAVKKHKRALTDRMRVSYEAAFASLVIATAKGDVTITPKSAALNLEIVREIDPVRIVINNGYELAHARMIYVLAASTPCGKLKSPKFEVIKSRDDDTEWTPGDFCPFGLFKIIFPK